MKLYQKHPKPLWQEQTKKLVEYLNKITIPDMPIVDVACGYGRNGAYLAIRDYAITFVDMDNDCLNFIAKGKKVSEEGDIPLTNISVIKADLTEEWPFPEKSLGGIICVHFYYPGLLNKWIRSLVHNGFLYFETIEARMNNASILPDAHEIREILEDDFTILHYSEREVKNYNYPRKKVSCTSFAVKT